MAGDADVNDRSVFRRVFRLPSSLSRVERAVDDELRFHLEGRVREFVAQGMTRDQAEAEARRRFGDFDNYRQETRSIDETTMTSRNRLELWDTVQREVRHAARVLVRTPAFSLIAFVTLALGIGATTAIYTVLEGVLLRPLSYPLPGELVSVMHPTSAPGSGERNWGLASVGYFHFKQNARSIADIGAYRTSTLSVADPGKDAVDARLAQVTATLFTVLRARPFLGRLINAEDDRPGGPISPVVLSYEFWRRHYGEDRDVIGRKIETAVAPLEIVGVAEPGLTLPKPGAFSSQSDLAGFGVDLWVSLNLDPATRQNNHALASIARLKPGFTVSDARRELETMTARFTELFPDVYSKRFMESYHFRVAVTPLLDEVLGPTVGKALWILFGAVALVLLIACANVANLFLVRMEARRRESAIRGALGADRRHMAVHHLAESLMLALAAGAAGVLLARIGIVAILAVAPRSIPRLAGVDLHWTSAVFGLALALVAGIVFGLMPLVRSRVDVQTLREGGRGLTRSRSQRTTRDALVVAQVALALMLLVGAGLMIRSFMQLRAVRPGIDPAGVLTLSVNLPYRKYRTMEEAAAFHEQLSARIAALPGVTAVGAVSALPLRDFGTGCTVVFRENPSSAKGEGAPCVHTVPALPGFFTALGIPVRGRVPEWSDVHARTHAVVITQALADRLWPGEDPTGKGIIFNNPNPPHWYRIVGVVPELRAGGLDQPLTEALFLAASSLFPQQSRWGMINDVEFVVKVSRSDPLDLVPAIRGIIRAMDPQIPLVNPTTMQTIVDRSMARTSFIMLLLGLAAAMALLLSAVGIYGVISYLVAQRRSEIGVRIALGAPIAGVVRLVMNQSVRLALLGVAIGLVGALAGTRLLQSLLFGVSPNDPLVLALVPLVLVTIAAVASFAPARRAARVDPVEALRS
jgi:putative ABC transport system permease protein